MLFGIINVTQQTVSLEGFADLRKAQQHVGLDKVDHGRVASGVGIVVDEFGLFKPPAQQRYFAIDGQLFAGNAVLYGYDRHGESIDLMGLPQVFFMPGADAVERSIQLGLVHRPQMKANGEVIWSWAEPRLY